MKKTHSLLLLLLLPLVFVLTLAVGIVWFFSIQAGEASIERLLHALSSQSVNDTKKRLEEHFTELRLVNEQNARALSLGLVPSSPNAVQKLFWWQKQSSGIEGYFIYGQKNGDFVDLGNPIKNNKLLVADHISQKEFGDTLLRSYSVDDKGNSNALLRKPKPYPFQLEPWFKDGITKKETFWTDVYRWETEAAKPKSIAVSSPVFANDGTVSGVMAIEQRLEQLHDVLYGLSDNSDVVVFLMDDKYNLIASSKGIMTERDAYFYQHPDVLAALNKLALRVDDSSFYLDWQGKKHFISVSQWDRKQGSAWPIAVIVPMDDFTSNFTRNKYFAVAVMGLAWLLLVTLGVLLYYRLIQRPVNQLMMAIQDVQQGDLSKEVPNCSVREFDEFSKAFNNMLVVLKSSYTKLERSNENLERKVEQRTQELERLRVKAEKQARSDSLTGLYNRRAFRELANNALTQMAYSGKTLSLVMMDIDHFKIVNDSWGHQSGDVVLSVLAKKMSQQIRHGDILARIGGEEFVLLLPDTNEDAAYALVERLRLSIMDTSINIFMTCINVTASFGIAEAKIEETSVDRLLKYADDALYYAKNHGRNQVVRASQQDVLHPVEEQ